MTLHRRQQRVSPRIPPETWTQVETLLSQEWSPEQVAGRLKLERRQQSISHERIYQHVYADKRAGGTLHRHLRCQKARRKRYGQYDRRGQLPARRGMEERPLIVERRARLGDGEADTLIGAGHSGAIVSVVERKSKLTREGLGGAERGSVSWAVAHHAVATARRQDDDQ